MKKRKEKKVEVGLTQADMDLAIMVNRIENRLTSLETKIDIILSRHYEKPSIEKNLPQTIQQPNKPVQFIEPSKNSNFKERKFFKAICADCNKDCEVPFRPTGDRPVYCKECYAKRRAGNTTKKEPAAAILKHTPTQNPEPAKHFITRNKKQLIKKGKKRK